jgi:branched-chain amino acid transport system substrate-binding protein
MTKRILAVVLVAAMLVIGLTGCQKAGTEWKKSDDGKTILEIGYIGPLTGEYANYGESVRNGALLAVEEINAKGGFNNFVFSFLKRIPRQALMRQLPLTVDLSIRV